MPLPPHLLLTTLLLLFPSPSHAQFCSGVGYRDVCCPGLTIGTPSNANNLDGLTCCNGDPTHAIQIGLSSCTAGNPAALTALASVSGGVSAGTMRRSPSTGGTEGSMTTQGKILVTGSGRTTMLTGSSSRTSGTGTTVAVETVGGTSTGTSFSTGGGAMITQGPLLLMGAAASIFAYGAM